jgi:prephenate dehydrogenase
MNAPELSRVLVVGAGLIGTSAGMALRTAGVAVDLAETDPRRLDLAVDLGAGQPVDLDSLDAERAVPEYDVALVCVPPRMAATVLSAFLRRGVGRAFSDVTSFKTQLQQDIESLLRGSSGAAATRAADAGDDDGLLARYVGGHPIAGRERGGPEAARADLFLGRPWALTPGPATDPVALELVAALVRTCGGVPVTLAAQAHDEAVAQVSHLPQAVASALAAMLRDVPDGAIALAGSGLRDLTRIADSDPALWAEIAAGNGPAIAPPLRRLAADLAELADAVDRDPSSAFRDVVAAGNAGRGRLPGKHGGERRDYVAVPVVISDEPGILARLFTDTGAAGINVEDVVIEHSPGAQVGLCELVVSPEQADALSAVLADAGWTVHPPSARGS